jgi:NSS family neurotransmitter:Na+ symporter
LDGLNKNATILRLGTLWKIMVKYVIPIILIVLWITGMKDLVTSGDTFALTMQSILIAALIIIPIILTKLPAKVDDF